MTRTFDCELTIKTWHNKTIDITSDPLLKDALYAALTNWNKLRWIDVYTPEKIAIKLFDPIYTATFRFPDFEMVQFVYCVSILRNGNPFRFRSPVFEGEFRKWLRHAFSGTSAKNINKWWSYERVYAEEHIQKLIQTGRLTQYGD